MNVSKGHINEVYITTANLCYNYQSTPENAPQASDKLSSDPLLLFIHLKLEVTRLQSHLMVCDYCININ